MKKEILILIGVLMLGFNTKAQSGFEAILLADSNDANKLMEAYFAPAMEGFIYGMNSGWYHTAKVHKTLGFDLSIGLSGAIVPSEKELFSISGLTSINQPSGTATGATFAGSNTETALTVERTVDFGGPIGSQNGTVNFNMPGGIGDDLPASAVPAPIVQLAVGLPYELEAIVRLVPSTSIGDDGGKTSMFGIGLKKEITNWFGPLDKLPLHVSLLAAYTTMDVTYGIADQNSEELEINNALTAFDLSAFNFQAIASLNFPIINVYGGIGYNSGSSNLKMTGTYEGTYTYREAGISHTEKIPLTPPDLKFDVSSFRTTIGARLSLGFFKIFGSYTLQEYNAINAGIAISIR